MSPGGVSSRAPAPAGRSRRRRRPSGEPPPLPRSLPKGEALVLLVALGVIVGWVALGLAFQRGFVLAVVDAWSLERAVALRSDGTVWVAQRLAGLQSDVALDVGFVAASAGLLVLRRFRRLLVLLGSQVVVTVLLLVVQYVVALPRPFGVEILGSWDGYGGPSVVLGQLTVLAVGIAFGFFPDGTPRRAALVVLAAVVGASAASSVLLATNTPSEVAVSMAVAGSLTVLAFRVLVPDQAYPVTYSRGRSAHLDLGGERGEAIRAGCAQQLGVEVVEVEPFGLEGSAGSSPMRLRIAGDPDRRFLFAKLYAAGHVRADRWYKLGRALAYGALEDEAPFKTVRRLVQFDDYLLRVMGDAGVPVVRSWGVVELTPHREYMLVTDFVEGAREIGDPEVTIDDGVVDSALGAVRALWDGGVAHRDIKPANVLVRDGRVVLIDTSFGEVRPSPWRQAVDLANMCLILALRTDPDRVWARATAFFTPDELAEGFAATRSVTMPSQLRALVRDDGRDLLGRFRALGPPRAPIPIQRWSARRVGLLASTVGLLLVGLALGWTVVFASGSGDVQPARCDDLSSLVIYAQSVPGAQLVPCIEELPLGWAVGQARASDTGSTVAVLVGQTGSDLDADQIVVTFASTCDPGRATEVPSEVAGARRYEQVTEIGASFAGVRSYVSDGSCTQYRFQVGQGTAGELVAGSSLAFGFVPRGDLDAVVAADTRGRVTSL